MSKKITKDIIDRLLLIGVHLEAGLFNQEQSSNIMERELIHFFKPNKTEVWVIQNDDCLILGCFTTKAKAEKFANNSPNVHIKKLTAE